MDHQRDVDSLTERLRSLGTQPIEDEARAAHERRMVSAVPAAAAPVGRRRFGPVAVGAAALVGFLAGSTGLAMAGALPDAAQDVAHDVLGVVQVDVPAGKDGKRGPCVAEAAKIDDEDEKQAAKEACPKGGPHDDDDDDGDGNDDAPGRSGEAPGRSDEAPGKTGEAPGKSGEAPGKSGDAPGRSGEAPGRSGEAPGQLKHADDPCRGKPPWAGPMSPEERAELKAEHDRSECADDENEADENEADADGD